MRFWLHITKDLTKLRWRRLRRRQKSNRFNKQNNNSAHASRQPRSRLASRFVCKFLCRLCTTTTWNGQISSLLENGNGLAKNSTISVWTRARSPLFSSSINSLLSSNWATWDNREIDWKGAKSIFQRCFQGSRRLVSDCKVPNINRWRQHESHRDRRDPKSSWVWFPFFSFVVRSRYEKKEEEGG